MSSLVLLLTGPLQSWGHASPGPRHRDTLGHPTRSGVIGLLASALGVPHGGDLAWADPLDVAVRVDQPGTRVTDYHTVGGGYRTARLIKAEPAKGKTTPKETRDTIVTHRVYLADAAFTVTVTGPDVDRLHAAVRAPHWAPFLGRKSCPPGMPVAVGVTGADPATVHERLPLYRRLKPWQQEQDVTVDVISTATDPGEATGTLTDVPVTFHRHDRAWAERAVTRDRYTFPPDRVAGTGIEGHRALTAALEAL